MKKINIGTRLLALVLPVIIVAMVLLTYISAINSSKIISEKINQWMDSELTANCNEIEAYLSSVSEMSQTLANVVVATYQGTSMTEYEDMIGKMIMQNDLVLGSGIWFEPYVYDKNEKYMGPYVYKDGGKAVVTYDYSNAEYDYFQYEWYTGAIKSSVPVFTDPYYDETLDMIMSSCTMPMYDADKNFLGVVTVDIELSKIQALVVAIKVGETGDAFLLSSSGSYIYNKDESKVMSSPITEDSNTSLADAGGYFMSQEKWTGQFTDVDHIHNLYTDTIENVGWKLVLEMDQNEINEPVNRLVKLLVWVAAVTLVLVVLLLLSQVKYISGNLKKVQFFAEKLAKGDFTIDALKVKSEDELGKMSVSLNGMYQGNKEVIGRIADDANILNNDGVELNRVTETLQTQFVDIESHMKAVNEDVMSISSATEEVNASVEEVNSSVSILTSETEKNTGLAKELKKRAESIEASFKESYDRTIDLTQKYEQNLRQSIDGAAVVESVGILTDVISSIAEQINLLSLNASIEAARAGEHGRGFAVVADEIGKLAGQTSKTINQIDETVGQVKKAFDRLTGSSKSLLTFVTDTVAPDYSSFLDYAKQYGVDAEEIKGFSQKISEMSSTIQTIISEVSEAVRDITESAMSTASASDHVMNSVHGVSDIMKQVKDLANKQDEMANQLNKIVSNFKL